MDWPQDNACLSQKTADLERLFKYRPQSSIVIEVVENSGFRMQIWSLGTENEWAQWLHCQASNNPSDRGFVLILAKRAGEVSGCEPSENPMTYSEWRGKLDANAIPKASIRRTTTFAPLGDNKQTGPSIEAHNTSVRQKEQSIRTLPFSVETFKSICEQFHIHESITRAMSRSDVPSFSCDSVKMGQPAYVYNCRTSNSWDSDLALTATYYPKFGFTYAMIFGCPQSVERSIVERLRTVTYEATHPLLLPGIFSELEMIRHKRLVETSINDVEAKIFELDFQANEVQYLSKDEIEKRNEAKRTSWLDLTYLRNSLITWNTQTLKMSKHAEELNAKLFNPCNAQEIRSHRAEAEETSRNPIYLEHRSALLSKLVPGSCTSEKQLIKSMDVESDSGQLKADIVYLEQMESVGNKIRFRLEAIRDEYDEKIRDCTMRVEGMAMATQWAHSETAVEVALATSRDSKVMRSISLVTMVFLPGTFFASIFSMSFFNWFGSEGKSRISSSVWIYVVITVLFTGVTIGLWYFFVIHRSTKRKVDEEKVIVD
ncbi:uncharacterized protein K460DRAFT_412448 [Cucurbitaria berberidis CBS 394.84]|uniref:Uncharacterized protein n=1 Tax=Cucurbitaria berberidis CBS 394.84 TaxID=1168544 RepID=A0A9P4GS87_9PLEO|nr:uncharacterized protein K460DRAFT_412448 [Cucurbitaria berberidis CBS 394.84]KAF1850800.1 hypothetical protein K460DRAFT_412448 [Cucurbitaria berberidis CBS 394.84]